MGEVHLAEHLGLRKKVAVKLLRTGDLATPDGLARFQQEASLAANIDHPNVIRVLHAGEQGGLHFMVLEYAEGESLADRIDRDGPLSADRVLDVAEQAARGLAAAHALGIVHRDIKPENLLLTRDGTIKVADFGIARAAFVQGGLTTAGTVLGTPYYMSPEQVEARPVDARTDLYSLGATLYYALTRRPPCVGETVHQIFSAILHSPPPRLSRVLPGIPPAVEALVTKLLEKDPGCRFANAEQVVEAVKEARTGKVPTAPPPPPSASRRFPVRTVVGVLVLAVAIIAFPRIRALLSPMPLVAGMNPMPPVPDNWAVVVDAAPGRWSQVSLPQGWSRDGTGIVGAEGAEPLALEVASPACSLEMQVELPEGRGGLAIDLVEGTSGYRIAWEDRAQVQWTRLPGGEVLGRAAAPAEASTTRRAQLVWDPVAGAGFDLDGVARLTGRIDDVVRFGTIRVLLRPGKGPVRIVSLLLLCMPGPPSEAEATGVTDPTAGMEAPPPQGGPQEPPPRDGPPRPRRPIPPGGRRGR